MKKIRIFFVLFCFLFTVESIQAQKSKVRLFSKVDIEPQYELPDGKKIALMGYTERLRDSLTIPGPILTFWEGDSVTLILHNYSQGAPHTIHLHGLDVDQANDGVPELSFSVAHGEQGQYKFVPKHPGLYLYHCHVVSPIHVQAGMYGLIIVRDGWRNVYGNEIYNSFYVMTSEIDTNWHTKELIQHAYDTNQTEISIPDYHPQYFLINCASDGPYIMSFKPCKNRMLVERYPDPDMYNLLGLANIGNCGNRFIFPERVLAQVVRTDGRPIPEGYDTVTDLEVMPGERYGVLLSDLGYRNDVDSVLVEYFDLNNGKVLGVQNIPIRYRAYSIDEKKALKYVRIFPNPSSNIFEIELSPPLVGQIDKMILVSLDGKKLRSYESFQERVDLSGLPNGVYTLQLYFNQAIIAHKLIKK